MKKEDQGIASGITNSGRYQLVPRTLAFVFCDHDVLLLRGAPGKRLWANLYNGVGGHVERGEDPATAARREILEETGLTVAELRLQGVVTIDVEPQLGIGLYVFSARSAVKQTKASGEGALHWFHPDRLPVSEMVEDLPALLDRVLKASPAAAPFSAHYAYSLDNRLAIRFSA